MKLLSSEIPSTVSRLIIAFALKLLMAGNINWAQSNLSELDESTTRSINTTKKTTYDLKLFTDFLVEIKDEKRAPEQIEEDVLINHMLEFFSGIKKRKDGSEFQPNTLLSIYNSIKRHLKDQAYTVNTDKLTPVIDLLKVKTKQLKLKGLGNGPCTPDHIQNHEVKQLFNEGLAGTHNPKALNNSMALVCSFLGFRGGDELYDRRLGDFYIVSIEDIRYLTVSKENLPKRKDIFKRKNPTDYRFGLPQLAETKTNTCPVRTFEMILAHRPSKYRSPESPLFLRPNSEEAQTVLSPHKIWFHNIRMGRKQIGTIISKMCCSSEVLDFSGRRITNSSVGKSITHSLSGAATTSHNFYWSQKTQETENAASLNLR